MSQTRWASLFKPARYGPVVGEGPARTLLDPGDLAPQDLVQHEARHYLTQDSILKRVFGGRFDVMPWLAEDAREFPRCAVYMASNFNSERPTATSVEMATAFIGTLWDAKAAEPVADGKASVATVQSHIKRVVRATPARVLVVWWNGAQTQLAHELVSIGGERYGPFTDIQGRVFGIVHEIEVQYRLHVDRSGRLVNLL